MKLRPLPVPPVAGVERRRVLLIGVAVVTITATVVVAALLLTAGLPGGFRAVARAPVPITEATLPVVQPLSEACRSISADLPTSSPDVAVLADGALQLVDLHRCERRTLVRSGVFGLVRSSADGRWIGYGSGLAVDRTGSTIVAPLGLAVRDDQGPTWVWSPAGATMAGVTVQGGLVVGEPGGQPQRLLPDGWGATEVDFADQHTVLVTRGAEVWTVDVTTGSAVKRYESATLTGPVSFATATSAWAVIWHRPAVAGSDDAASAPLLAVSLNDGAVHELAPAAVLSSAAVAPCGDGVVAAVADDPADTRSTRIEVYRAPGWHRQVIGPGTTPTCDDDGTHLTYSRGDNTGAASRGVVVVELSATTTAERVLTPPADASAISYEQPLFYGTDTVLFVSSTSGADAITSGTIALARLGDPADPAHTITGLGPADDTFYDWSDLLTPVPR